MTLSHYDRGITSARTARFQNLLGDCGTYDELIGHFAGHILTEDLEAAPS